MAEHNTLTGASLHEPKGVASANNGEVYRANGAGSGSWGAIPSTVHAAAKVSGNSTEITPSGAGTFMEWTPTWTSVDADGVTITGNSFVIVTAGSYFIQGTMSCTGRGTGSNTYAYDFAVDGTPVSQKSRRLTSSTTDVGAVAIQAYLADLTVGQVVKLYVTNETDTDNVLITDFNVFISLLNV